MEEIFYREGFKLNVKIENRDVEFKFFRVLLLYDGFKNFLLIWRMMEKVKFFICGCLNVDRKGIIYFGVDDVDYKIFGFEIKYMMDEIIIVF